MPGWKAYFRLAETPGALADIDAWVRHRLRAVQLDVSHTAVEVQLQDLVGGRGDVVGDAHTPAR